MKMEMQSRPCFSKALILLFVYAVLTVSFSPMFTEAFALSIDETGNYRRLVTSNNPDFYSVIETDGNTITARGVHKSDIPTRIGISGISVSVSFHGESNGSYTAELNYIPISEGYYTFYIALKSGAVLSYLMKYTDGWYFPDNGLGLLNGQKLEKAYEAAPEAAVYYLSAAADKGEVESALSQIDSIVKEVCGDESDDYKKAYLLNRWVADNIYYDHDAAENSVTLDTVAIYNVLERRRTTCAGFANTYSALLEAAGIRSLNLKGAVTTDEVSYDELTEATENHEFTAFWYEEQKRWVYADSCWSGAGDYENGVISERITYDKYFDITDEAFSLNHRIDKVEERHYSKALEILEDGFSQTRHETETITGEGTDGASSGTDGSNPEKPVVTNSGQNKPSSGSVSGGESQSVVPFVIIGLTGVLVIAAGIILAVHNRKK